MDYIKYVNTKKKYIFRGGLYNIDRVKINLSLLKFTKNIFLEKYKMGNVPIIYINTRIIICINYVLKAVKYLLMNK